MKKKIKKILLVAVAVYILLGILLFLFQDFLLFHPRSLEKDYRFRFSQPFEEVNIQMEGRNLHLIRFKANGERRGIVLFFHGNMNNIEHYAAYSGFFTNKGLEVWMPDYPGFGKSTGERTEKNMYADAEKVYDMAAAEMPAGQITIYGKSMGTGLASYIASKQPARQLVLETPYYSIDALARHYFPIFPVVPMTKYSFPVHQYLNKAKMPVTIFHGKEDEIIPFRQARKLQEENAHARLVVIEKGGHNNLSGFPGFRLALDSLLQ